MTTALESQSGVAHVFDAVRDFMPEIGARASEVESARRVPLDLLDRLKAAGAFGVILPRSHGGVGSTLPEGMRFFEELSRVDASVGWITLIGGGTWLDLLGLPRSTFDAMYQPGSVTVVAGVFSPTGTAVPVSDGYQVNGRWSFASGCEHADWIYGNCVDTSSGEPELRTAVFRPEEVEIEDTWRVLGLCGTGSHHFSVHDVVVPSERTLRVFADPPCIESPFSNIPVVAAIALLLATVPIGIAQAALDDIVELATDKVPLLSTSSLAGNALFQYELADADARLRAARALLYQGADRAWEMAVAGDEFTPALRAQLRSAAAHAATTAVSVVDTAFRSGGGSALYLENPLQRRLRDAHTVSQHFLLKPDTLTTCGAVLAGESPDLTVF